MPTTGPAGLLGKLARLADPRSPRGRRHSLASVLLCVLCAMVAGASHLRAVGQWADAAPQHTLARLSCRITCAALGVRTAPSPATIRRVLLSLDPEALTTLARPDVLEVVAVDGKTLRGSATAAEAAVHLLAALAPDRRLVARVRVPAGTSEIDALAVLLEGVDLDGVVVTADALHTRADTATHLVTGVARRLRVGRQTQPEDAVRPGQSPALGSGAHPGHHPGPRTRAGRDPHRQGHRPRRTYRFPARSPGSAGAPLRKDRRTGEVSWTCAYAVTSLEVGQAGAARIGALVRGHGGIEAWASCQGRVVG
ncbi:ISAs1 family transposase [Nocardiopsis flavescens]|uniref:ISAs1 family transposase n=1 Tax=Nocardiopsis flavescens TaxID=758803 RepID=UPI00365A502F